MPRALPALTLMIFLLLWQPHKLHSPPHWILNLLDPLFRGPGKLLYEGEASQSATALVLVLMQGDIRMLPMMHCHNISTEVCSHNPILCEAKPLKYPPESCIPTRRRRCPGSNTERSRDPTISVLTDSASWLSLLYKIVPHTSTEWHLMVSVAGVLSIKTQKRQCKTWINLCCHSICTCSNLCTVTLDNGMHV